MTLALMQAQAAPEALQPTPVVVGAPQPLPPLTASELEQLRDRRQSLSDQLISARERRGELAAELRRDLPGADARGLEQQIRVLDDRLVQLELDIAATGRELTMQRVGGATTTDPARFGLGKLNSGQVTAISIVFIVSVLAPIAMAYARRLWRRASAPPPTDFTPVVRRLEQLQQAVDTVAIEVERMSEGQRYVAKVITEGSPPLALGPGQHPAEPIRISDEDRLRVRRGE